MLKLNNKGFALVETLIVSVFVLTIFTLLYTNLLPIMGEYEKRDNYDDIDSVYKTFFIKNFIENNGITLGSDSDFSEYTRYHEFCNSIKEGEKFEYCKKLWEVYNINDLVITKYDMSGYLFFSDRLTEYTKNIPKTASSTYNKRIIVEYKKEVDEEHREDRDSHDIYRYSTIGVNIYG